MQFPTFINKNISHAGGISEKAMAATVEAVIGAAFLDGGFNAVQTVTVNLGLHDTPYVSMTGNDLRASQ
ncbi:hypothetical protein EG328_006524 [Venturia inaequalis]|uniref:Uncharacterized protein n=1 Tax=Venturia inaequalis TaxID=5025 RepID=A0A8H3YU32_VENIN|nr:hypothetical protein EG328_006524 [Venturia inaequalis]KAE9979381.1 hypothetical protein EG327_007043 [Venturia inaequalis]